MSTNRVFRSPPVSGKDDTVVVVWAPDAFAVVVVASTVVEVTSVDDGTVVEVVDVEVVDVVEVVVVVVVVTTVLVGPHSSSSGISTGKA